MSIRPIPGRSRPLPGRAVPKADLVEIANSWSDTDLRGNAAALQGEMAGLEARGVTHIGIYATRDDWAEITGATAADSPINAPFASLSK
jgi:hypothetical protein